MSKLITLDDPRSPAAEAYQSLRTNLEFSGLNKALHTILLTSADAAVDKSSAIANLAVVMAQAGDRVILVDGDLRRPMQHDLFGVSNARGLAGWLAEGGDAPLLKTEVEGLMLLPAGPAPANPIALLSARRLEETLAHLAEKATYVLVDAPPVLTVTDAALWANKVDGVVLLVNAGSTKREHAQRAKAVLAKVQANILGAVLLNADRDAMLAGYGG
jgi:capsular exopolysaccharide synthesis family protein